jgi:hypothetical protein
MFKCIFFAAFSELVKASFLAVSVLGMMSMSSAYARICTDLKNMVPLVIMFASLITVSRAILKRRQAKASP